MRFFEKIELAPVVERQIHRQLPLLLPAEDLVERMIRSKRSMRVVRIGRRPSEARVVVISEGRQEVVARLDRGDAAEAKLLDETILQRQVRPLDASLGIFRVTKQGPTRGDGTTQYARAMSELNIEHCLVARPPLAIVASLSDG
jgi:hypothetical protein